MKKLFKVLAVSTMCIGMQLLNACSFFRESNADAVSIKEILVEYDEEGNANITIYYTDKNKEPTPVTLPRGKDGEIGNGIQKITYEPKEDGTTTVTITYTDESMKPVSFDLKPGRSITDVKFSTDDAGNTLIIFIDNEENELPPITVFKGDSGEQGIGIASIIPNYNPDGSATITITMDDGFEYFVEIPAPKEGRGIDSIVSRKEGTQFYLTINYSDGTSDDLSFDAPPSWTTGYSRPGDNEGYDGDYYFDIAHDLIYIKENGQWSVAVDFSTTAQEYNVTFDLNDTNAEPASLFGNRSYIIHRGETFYSSNYTLPIALRTGYTFGGWSTSKTPNVTNGLFTDLTPVVSDMTLYAVWKE